MFPRLRPLAAFVLLVVFPVGASADPGARTGPPCRLLLIGQGPDNHPAGTHEYLPGVRVIANLLSERDDVRTTVVSADGPWAEAPELLGKADGAVLFVSEGAKWISAEPRRLDAFARLAARRGGLVVLHWGMGTREAEPIGPFLELFGGCHGGPDRKYKFLETEVRPAGEHPAVAGLEPFRVRDEFYYKLKWSRTEPKPQPLLVAEIDGEAQPVAWAWERPAGGRSAGFSGLHFHENWGRSEYRRLVLQSILWTLDLPIPSEGVAADLEPEAVLLPR